MRVLIADDSVLLREGAARILSDAGFDVVAQAGDAEDLLRKARAHKPDVAVVDIRMPPGHGDDGLQAARTIRAEMPQTGVLLVSQYVEERYAVELLQDGSAGVGYLLKDRIAEIERFVDAVRTVGEALGRRRDADPLAALTPREREVLELMAEGRTNRAIAGVIHLSERAVERNVTAIFEKLGLPPSEADHRRVLAVLTFLRT
jgi:DNA-binding NarL/FixJ family response regulator